MTFSRSLSVTILATVVWIPAASAQFGGMPGMPGMGMPGMGGPGMGAPGFGAPQPAVPPACQTLMTLRDETQKNSSAIRTIQEKAQSEHKPMDPVIGCKLFKVFLASHTKFIQGLAANQAACGVPPEVIKAAKEEHGKISEISTQVCDAAEHPRPTGPTLSDALNSAPTLPDVDNSKRGPGTYDTLDGSKPFVR